MKTCTHCGDTKEKSEFPKHRRVCIKCRSAYRKTIRHKEPSRANAITRKSGRKMRARNKRASFDAYGGAFCACCGETEMMFLTIDHVNGGGSKHRKSLRGANIHSWLKQNGYPEGFQVLCANCNLGRLLNGGTCPHQTKGGEG